MNTKHQNTIELHGNILAVDDSLFDFTIFQRQSSNVDYYGIDHGNKRLFVQFKGGTGSYIYNCVDSETLNGCKLSDSIGKYISKYIVGKFQVDKIPSKLINPINDVL